MIQGRGDPYHLSLLASPAPAAHAFALGLVLTVYIPLASLPLSPAYSLIRYSSTLLNPAPNPRRNRRYRHSSGFGARPYRHSHRPGALLAPQEFQAKEFSLKV